jgi:hypothetical protein
MHSSALRIFGPRNILSIAMVTASMFITGCSNADNVTRDTASAGGTVSASASASEQRGTVTDDADVKDYRLTMDKVNRYYDAFREFTIAAGNRAESDTLEDFESIDALVKEIEQEPKVVAAVRRAGLSVREYVVMSFSLMMAGMANEVLKVQPNANLDSLAREMEIPAENLRFVREHQAEIERKANEAKAAVRAAGVNID